MAHKLGLHWTPRALSDFIRIVEYIKTANPLAANQFAASVQHQVELLRQFPQLGKESLPGVRQLVVHTNYLLRYRVQQSSIVVLQLRHAARKPG